MPNDNAVAIVEKYTFHTRLIHHFLDGISHGESVLQLPFEHNCLNWILGHIVTNRSHVLETVCCDHGWAEAVRAHYHDGTPPVRPDSPALNINELTTHLDESVSLLGLALEGRDDVWLAASHDNYRGEKSRLAHLNSFYWHEGFHIGQLEILKAFIEGARERPA